MDFDIFEKTVLLVQSGSRLYGINTESSDFDVQGVAVPPPKYFFGTSKFEQFADINVLNTESFLSLFSNSDRELIAKTKLEGTIFDIRKYVKLAADNNPNILDTLFAPESKVLKQTAAGRILRENAPKILNKYLYYRFTGYATEQLNKMETHRQYLLNPITERPTRESFDLRNTTDLSDGELATIYAAVSKHVDKWENAFPTGMSQSDIWMIKSHYKDTLKEMAIAKEERYLLAERRLGIPSSISEYFAAERKFNKAVDDYKSYQKWLKDRNPERAALEAKFGYDTKFAVHLIRLLRACRDLLKTGTYDVCRTGIDADLLLQVRAGQFKYEEVLQMSEDTRREAEDLFNKNPANLPSGVDRDFVEELQLRVIEAAYGEK